MIQLKNAVTTIALLISSTSVASELKARPVEKIQKLAKKLKLADHQYGYALYDMEARHFIDIYNSKHLFIPASLQKVFSLYFALSVLGPKESFETHLKYDGRISKGVLKGDLYLQGSGDPLLTTAKLENFVLAMKEQGIKEVTGNLYLTDNSFPNLEKISLFGNGDQTYNQSLSDLNLDFNRFQIRRSKSRRTAKADFDIIPSIDFLHIEKIYKPFNPGQKFKYLGVKKGKETWAISTYESYKKVEEVPIRNSMLFAGYVFHKLANQNGIKVNKPSITKKHGSRFLYSYKSESALELSKLAMEYSNNLITEILVLKASKSLNKKVETIEDAAIEMKKWYEKSFKELDWKQAFFANASGLSLSNKVTPEFLAKFVAQTKTKKFNDTYFKTLYSLSGHSGWVRKRFNEESLNYRVWAKTGSLDYVNNITGVLQTKSGKSLAYSIFVNDFEKRKKIESGNDEYVHSLKVGAKAWNSKTDILIHDLVENWASR